MKEIYNNNCPNGAAWFFIHSSPFFFLYIIYVGKNILKGMSLIIYIVCHINILKKYKKEPKKYKIKTLEGHFFHEFDIVDNFYFIL